MNRIVTEAIEGVLHPLNMKQEDGFCVNRLWKYLLPITFGT
jgi:hypothetical protein